ncbi:MAG TPA: class I SAM-dependent methyltransferase [Nevskiaceae bacterium]|nr:class I SAM-dependent methyltransferase [Nevskiaceae bacterium]
MRQPPAESSKQHWDAIYARKSDAQVSWFEELPRSSLDFIARTGMKPGAAIIDVGGGRSRLIDALLDAGHHRLSVLDISGNALASARERLGARAARVQWLEADILSAELPAHGFDVWHDRAVFHFLTGADQRSRYVETLYATLKADGQAVIATFGPAGPLRCSGCDVVRYSAASLSATLGSRFQLLEQQIEIHHTPFGTTQQFLFCRFAKH